MGIASDVQETPVLLHDGTTKMDNHARSTRPGGKTTYDQISVVRSISIPRERCSGPGYV